uniref:Uncharacterized protein n=1 Tax=Meleagris gallopavo TaxID=9103 RepID=A0A803YP05_MELGA
CACVCMANISLCLLLLLPQSRIMELEGKVRRAAAERGAVELKKNEFQGELQKQREQIDKIQSLHSFQMENANRVHWEEKVGTLLTTMFHEIVVNHHTFCNRVTLLQLMGVTVSVCVAKYLMYKLSLNAAYSPQSGKRFAQVFVMEKNFNINVLGGGKERNRSKLKSGFFLLHCIRF